VVVGSGTNFLAARNYNRHYLPPTIIPIATTTITTIINTTIIPSTGIIAL